MSKNNGIGSVSSAELRQQISARWGEHSPVLEDTSKRGDSYSATHTTASENNMPKSVFSDNRDGSFEGLALALIERLSIQQTPAQINLTLPEPNPEKSKKGIFKTSAGVIIALGSLISAASFGYSYWRGMNAETPAVMSGRANLLDRRGNTDTFVERPGAEIKFKYIDSFREGTSKRVVNYDVDYYENNLEMPIVDYMNLFSSLDEIPEAQQTSCEVSAMFNTYMWDTSERELLDGTSIVFTHTDPTSQPIEVYRYVTGQEGC